MTFLSKCLSSRVRASVSPPGHTAEDKPSVSKPANHVWRWISLLSSDQIETFVIVVLLLTQLLQGWNSKLVIVVFGKWRSAFTHGLCCNGFYRPLNWIHATDEGLETLVGEGRLTSIQLYDPAQKIKNTVGHSGSEWTRITISNKTLIDAK